MRNAVLPGMLVLFIGSAANAQLSIQPQIGLEQSRTSFNFNNSSFASLPNLLDARGAIRLDYKFKKGHGPYMSVGSAPGTSNVQFNSFDNVLHNYTTSVGATQLRLEGGYQYTSKRINFKKGSSQQTTAATRTTTNTTTQKRCGSYSYRSSASNARAMAPKVDNRFNMRLQPSAGAAFIPGAKENVTVDPGMNQTNFQYRAGNYTSALATGLGFLFAKGTRDLFSLNLYHWKGLSNLDNETLTRVVEGKTTTSQISSKTSSWSLSLGLPLQFQKQKQVKQAAPVKSVEKQENYKSRCGQYRSQYSSRCTRAYN